MHHNVKPLPAIQRLSDLTLVVDNAAHVVQLLGHLAWNIPAHVGAGDSGKEAPITHRIDMLLPLPLRIFFERLAANWLRSVVIPDWSVWLVIVSRRRHSIILSV